MLRRNGFRLGHQIIPEPLPNVEHGSLARGRMTAGRSSDRLNQRMYLAGAGFVAFFWSTIYSGDFTRQHITAEGKITTA